MPISARTGYHLVDCAYGLASLRGLQLAASIGKSTARAAVGKSAETKQTVRHGCRLSRYDSECIAQVHEWIVPSKLRGQTLDIVSSDKSSSCVEQMGATSITFCLLGTRHQTPTAARAGDFVLEVERATTRAATLVLVRADRATGGTLSLVSLTTVLRRAAVVVATEAAGISRRRVNSMSSI